VKDVMLTLAEAIGLVFLVMLLSSRTCAQRSIPTIAIPVVLLGTAAVLAAFGYSINSLTLFGMVLAIGLLVDDAIVVVENVERVNGRGASLAERGDAAVDGSDHGCVGRHCARALGGVRADGFLRGSGGVIYRSSLTIVSSMILSVLVALIFTPPSPRHCSGGPSMARCSGAALRLVQLRFHARTSALRSVGVENHAPSGACAPRALDSGRLATLGYLRLPGGYLPDEDRAIMFVQVTALSGSRIPTCSVCSMTSPITSHGGKAGRRGGVRVRRYSFGGHGQTAVLPSFRSSRGRNGRASATASSRSRALSTSTSPARRKRWSSASPPAALELGNATGFDFELIDKADLATLR